MPVVHSIYQTPTYKALKWSLASNVVNNTGAHCLINNSVDKSVYIYVYLYKYVGYLYIKVALMAQKENALKFLTGIAFQKGLHSYTLPPAVCGNEHAPLPSQPYILPVLKMFASLKDEERNLLILICIPWSLGRLSFFFTESELNVYWEE